MWLSLDQGGHASRAVVFDAAGEIVARAESPVATRRHGLQVEHDAAELLESVRTCLEQIGRALGPRSTALVAAGVATQRSSLVAARRRSGQLLTPVLSWQDRRAAEDLAALDIDPARVSAITGLPLSAHYGAGKIRWLLAHDAAVGAAAAARDLVAAPLASLIVRVLGGTRDWRIDPANASRLLLMDAERLAWSDELLQAFGLDRAVLPDIHPNRADFGTLSIGSVRVPVRAMSGDQSAALYCMGAPRPGTAFVNIGTGAFIQLAVGSQLRRIPGLLSSVVWSDAQDRLYVVEGTVNGAGAALESQLDALGWPTRPGWPEWARLLSRPGRRGVFLNGVSGLGSPDWVADFPSRYLDTTDAEDKLAAVIDSIVFLILRNLEAMRRAIEIDRIVLTGGLAQLDYIGMQLAGLLGQPVLRLADPEATARGMAYLTSGGRMAADVAGAAPTRFEPVDDHAMRERHARWQHAMQNALAA